MLAAARARTALASSSVHGSRRVDLPGVKSAIGLGSNMEGTSNEGECRVRLGGSAVVGRWLRRLRPQCPRMARAARFLLSKRPESMRSQDGGNGQEAVERGVAVAASKRLLRAAHSTGCRRLGAYATTV